jgi:hypothetical protein
LKGGEEKREDRQLERKKKREEETDQLGKNAKIKAGGDDGS